MQNTQQIISIFYIFCFDFCFFYGMNNTIIQTNTKNVKYDNGGDSIVKSTYCRR